MKGYITALGLSLLLGAAGAASATTATIDFNTPTNTTASTQLIANGPNGATTTANFGGRNAVMTGGSSSNQYLYVVLPKGLFANSKAVWAVIDYYDQGTGTFATHFTDTNGNDVQAEADLKATTKHDTKTWTTYSIQLTNFNFTESGPGGADVWIDDMGDGNPMIIDKISVTDEDPSLTHFPHVDPAHPIKIGAFDNAAWDGAYTVTLNTAAQDALGGVNWKGPQDFSGVYYHKWDESGLYVRGDVIDSTPRLNDQPGNTAWDGDGLEEFLALDWSDPSHSAYLPGTDFHVFIGLGDPANGSMPPQWGVQYAASDGTHMDDDLGAIPAQNLAIKNTTNPVGYQFELYLPWTTLLGHVMNTTTKITAGQKIGWFMFANDSKVIGPSSQASGEAMDPVKRTGPSGNPSKWVTTVLEPFQAQPVTNPNTPKPNAGQ